MMTPIGIIFRLGCTCAIYMYLIIKVASYWQKMIIFFDGMFTTVTQLKLEHHNFLAFFQLKSEKQKYKAQINCLPHNCVA